MSILSSLRLPDDLIRSKKRVAVLTVLVIFTALLIVFKWDWLRPSLINYVSQKSERNIKIGKLDVEFSGFLNPTIKFEDLYIPNASWADERPLVSARRISFSFNAVQFLLNPKSRIVHVSMSDAEVNLERLRDGLRNWRLLKPNYKGPGKYVLLSLTAQRSLIRFNNHALDVDLSARISAHTNLNTSSNLNSKQLPNKIIFSGNYQKLPFNGMIFSDAKVTFQRTKTLFKMTGYLQSGKNKITVMGKLGDVYKNPLIDADVKISGNLYALINLIKNDRLVGQNAFNSSSHILKLNEKYQFKDFIADFNGSDLKGNFSYLHNNDAPKATGSFLSETIDFKELSNLFTQIKKSKPDSENNSSLMETLKKSQLNLMLKIQKIINIKNIKLENLNLKVNGHAGKFDMKIEDTKINGGKILVNANLDISKEVPTVQTEVMVNQLQIANLLDSTNLDNKISAPLDIKMNIHSKGNALSEIESNLSGDADITLGKGIISNKLDAKLGLDFGKVLWLSLRGDKGIVLNCGKLGLNIKQGIATSNLLWVNTEQTIIEGEANLDFVNKRVNVLLDPQPKDSTLFAKDSSIQLSGQLDDAKYTVNTTSKQLKKPAQHSSNHDCSNS